MLLQLHLNSRLNTWLQLIGQRQLQQVTKIIQVLGLGASYVREFTVIVIQQLLNTTLYANEIQFYYPLLSAFNCVILDKCSSRLLMPLRCRRNGRYSVSNHQPRDCLLNRLFRHRSKKTPKLRVAGLCAGNSPETGEFPHKWPVTRKIFPFDDVIMHIAIQIAFCCVQQILAETCQWVCHIIIICFLMIIF